MQFSVFASLCLVSAISSVLAAPIAQDDDGRKEDFNGRRFPEFNRPIEGLSADTSGPTAGFGLPEPLSSGGPAGDQVVAPVSIPIGRDVTVTPSVTLNGEGVTGVGGAVNANIGPVNANIDATQRVGSPGFDAALGLSGNIGDVHIGGEASTDGSIRGQIELPLP